LSSLYLLTSFIHPQDSFKRITMAGVVIPEVAEGVATLAPAVTGLAAAGAEAAAALGIAAGFTIPGFFWTTATIVVGLTFMEGLKALWGDLFGKRDIELANTGGSQVVCQWDTTNLRRK
jgi:hypothetical protein